MRQCPSILIPHNWTKAPTLHSSRSVIMDCEYDSIYETGNRISAVLIQESLSRFCPPPKNIPQLTPYCCERQDTCQQADYMNVPRPDSTRHVRNWQPIVQENGSHRNHLAPRAALDWAVNKNSVLQKYRSRLHAHNATNAEQRWHWGRTAMGMSSCAHPERHPGIYTLLTGANRVNRVAENSNSDKRDCALSPRRHKPHLEA